MCLVHEYASQNDERQDARLCSLHWSLQPERVWFWYGDRPSRKENRLAFRGIPGTLAKRHLEGSECCLIHADNHYAEERGVFVNPAVRVGYNPAAYQTVNPGAGVPWLSSWQIVRGSWENRARRWLGVGSKWWEQARVRRRVKAWEADERSSEAGSQCIVDEMQVLAWNGWAHI